MPRKPERSANLLWENDCYRVVSDFEIGLLRGRNKVYCEKTRADKGLYVYFYKRTP